MTRRLWFPAALILAMLAVLGAGRAEAFCGFYVAKADTRLFNKASKVVLMRDGMRTAITMVNDYQGELTEFAIVIPVPYVLERGQIHVTENAIVDHLDAYTAPRLVEYFDEDPCRRLVYEEAMPLMSPTDGGTGAAAQRAKALGVTIEASYTVGEYDILILSGEESAGLITWLKENDYRIPDGAEPVVDSYIRGGMKFLVAKVNLDAQSRLGFTYLRPLQLAFESKMFMLPIRLGMINAEGKQELFVFALTRTGRVETSNYRTVRIPSNQSVPLYVRDRFAEFYAAMFREAVDRENGRAVFLEYAWDMSWCDPCAADPLDQRELRELGVYWLEGEGAMSSIARSTDVFVTRLHLSYDSETFPEDLVFRVTGDRENFQGRYVLNHPWSGPPQCEEAYDYYESLPDRFEEEAQTAARLTGWDIADVRADMSRSGQDPDAFRRNAPKRGKWWERIWGGQDRQ